MRVSHLPRLLATSIAVAAAVSAAYFALATPEVRVLAGRPSSPPRLSLAARPVTHRPEPGVIGSLVATSLSTPAPLGLSGTPRLINSVPAAGKRVALTFDLCEEADEVAGYDKPLVDILIEREVKATFFMGGKWAESHPEEAAFLGSQQQFEIGSHSWTHTDLSKATPEQIDEQVDLAQAAIARRSGRTPLLFRLPFGFGDERTVARIGEHGLRTIQWDVVTGDPDKNFRTKQIMMQVRDNLDDGSIIIMHANGRGWHTAEALPTVLEYLTSKGYEVVTVGELMGYL